MLDPAASAKRVHTGVDILVQVESFLGLGDSTARVHEDGVEEIRVTVVELAANPRERSRRKSSERLFLSGSNVTKDSNVFSEEKTAHHAWRVSSNTLGRPDDG